MHATQYARDALANAKARAAVCSTGLPELSSRLHSIGDRELSRFRTSIDESFAATFNNALGYFQLKRYLYSVGEHDVVSFLEDVVHYRNMRQAHKRAVRARDIVVTYNSAALVRASVVDEAKTAKEVDVRSSTSTAASGVATASKRRATFAWGTSRAVHVSPMATAAGTAAAAAAPGAAPAVGAADLSPAAAARGVKALPPLARRNLRPTDKRPHSAGRRGPGAGVHNGVVDAGGGAVAAFTTLRSSAAAKLRADKVETPWNSDERLGAPAPTYLATTLLDSFVAAGLDPDRVRVEEEWVRIATDLSAAMDGTSSPARRARGRRRSGSPVSTSHRRGSRARSPTSHASGKEEADMSESDTDMDADSDDGGTSTMSDVSGRSASASKAARRARRRAMAQAAVKELFDYIVVAVMHQLGGPVFAGFRKTHFYSVYIRLRHLCYTCKRTLTHDDFDWLGRLGRGGYGAVYAARKRDTGKLYAVKCMDKRLIKVRRATRLIVTERHVLASVDNPFITGLKYAFHNAQEVVLVMEMMTGGDLEYYLVRKGRFAEQLARFYCAEVLLALKYLHEHGIVHRDVKPSNILLGTDGHIRLSDLGLAVFLGVPHQLQTGTDPRARVRRFVRGKAGTPGFWAPEMLVKDADGRSGKYDHAADWWSYGCLLYALLAGRGPFTVAGGDTNDDNQATLKSEPRYPPHVFSKEAEDLIRKLLAKNPASRLGSGPTASMEIMEHPFFADVDWHLLAERALPPPWKPPYDAVTPDTSLSQKDVAREAKLKAVMLTAQDHAHYCDIPYSSTTSVEQELVENLTMQAARAATNTRRRRGDAGAGRGRGEAAASRKNLQRSCAIM